ncbi:hypothetical protein M1413_01255 [Patescibacteria group bacterium]|nr:hypothetical protein [Patescibacteria group bacterium]MCL5114273.1 hypothetical protein [Patescibacteria group bacterium]
MSKQQKPQDPMTVRLEFPTADLIVGTDDFKQRVVAVITRGSKAIQFGNVQFYLNGMASGGVVPIGYDGRSLKEIVVPAGVKHMIGATIVGTSVSVSEERLLPKPEAKKKSEYAVIPLVTNKLVEFIIKVSDSDGKSLQDVDVTVYELTNKLESKALKTDPDGQIKHAVHLRRSKKTEIIIVVSGFSADKVFRHTYEGK